MWAMLSFPKGKAYKPSLDQVSLTRMLNFTILRTSQARSFCTLENALRFLSAPGSARVYPPPR